LQLAGIQREENTPTIAPLRLLPPLLYGAGHAYGNSFTGSGTTASVEKLTREDLVKFHNVWFRPNNSTLVIVGDTKLDEIKPKLEKLFATWKSGDVPKKNIGTVSLPAKSVFRIIAPVQTDKTKESLVELNKELRGILTDKPIAAAELAKTQDQETLELPGSRETLDALETSIDDQVQYGLPDDYWQTYGGKVRALTVADVEAAAKTIVHPDNIIWIVVGDRAKIEAGIRELNLGEVHIITPEGKISQ
jgi:predicted Zn-dependent peptidase